jgi:hypothetical protein
VGNASFPNSTVVGAIPGIKSKTIRVEGVTGPAKGYYRADFEEDFACYLPRSSSVTVSQTSIFNHVGQTRCVTSQCTVTDENQPKSLEDKPCYAVTDENLASANLAEEREEREEREDGAPDDDLDPAPDDHTCAQCKGPVDGRERLCALGDDMVWLHPQCERFYIVAQDLPW